LLFCASSALNRGGRVGSALKDPAPHFVKNAMPSYRNGSQFANFVIGDVWRGIEDIELTHGGKQAPDERSGFGFCADPQRNPESRRGKYLERVPSRGPRGGFRPSQYLGDRLRRDAILRWSPPALAHRVDHVDHVSIAPASRGGQATGRRRHHVIAPAVANFSLCGYST